MASLRQYEPLCRFLFLMARRYQEQKTSTKRCKRSHVTFRSFDVTNLVKKSGKNVIAVLITDADQKKDA